MLRFAEKAVGKTEGSTKINAPRISAGLSNYVEEFFVGITHDKNFRRFANYMDTERPDLDKDSKDVFQYFGVERQGTLERYFSKRVKEDDLVHPIFSNYRQVSLD